MKFSVIITTYRRRDLVIDAVRSVLEQTLSAYEIIVVVEGSIDDTANALRLRYPQVKVIEQENTGISAARNHGIAHATGDWIGFVDDVDYWHREKLADVAAFVCAHANCDAVYHPVWHFTEETGLTERLGVGCDFVASSLEECHATANRMGLDRAAEFGGPSALGRSFELTLPDGRGLASGALVRRNTLVRAGLFPVMQSEDPDWTMAANVSRLCEWQRIPLGLAFKRFQAEPITYDRVERSFYLLAGLLAAWYSGRPLKIAAHGWAFERELRKFGPTYREAIRAFHWNALRRGDLVTASRIRTIGRLLLPQWRDYIFALVPPSFASGWRRHVSSRFSRSEQTSAGVAPETANP